MMMMMMMMIGTCEASRFEFESAVPIRFDSKVMGRFDNFRIGRYCKCSLWAWHVLPIRCTTLFQSCVCETSFRQINWLIDWMRQITRLRRRRNSQWSMIMKVKVKVKVTVDPVQQRVVELARDQYVASLPWSSLWQSCSWSAGLPTMSWVSWQFTITRDWPHLRQRSEHPLIHVSIRLYIILCK